MAKILTPATIAALDYPQAQQPVLGGEVEVWLTTKPSRLLGVCFFTADDTLQFTFRNTPLTGPPGGPIVAIALESGVMQTGAASTITYAGLTGSFQPIGWAANKGFNFATGRGVELDGTYAAPTSSSVPTVATGMKQGTKFALVEMPALADFVLAGCTNNRTIKVPVRGTKNIPCGMNEAEWTTPGRVKPGELEITGLNQSIDDGLGRFLGLNCQAMLVSVRGGRLITQRTFCLDYTPEADIAMPEGEGESTITARGQFSKYLVLPAA